MRQIANKPMRFETKMDVSKLVAGVAHDIRSPIAVMEMGLHRIGQTISTKELMIFKMAIQRVRDITNNLLDQYRGVLESNSELIKPILEQVLTLKRYEWYEKECELTFSFDPEIEFLRFNIVADDISRMVSNLLNNAIEACEDHAKIHVCVNKVDKNIEISITDNGIGIPAEKIENYLAGESTKHPGVGIGLSNAKHYIESIGGSLGVKSKLGLGTTIILKLVAG